MVGKYHKYSVNPEFANLDKFVWEGLNNIGRSISQIEDDENRVIKDNPKHKNSKGKQIWHTKSEIDRYVEQATNLNLKDYGSNMSKNALYKAIANAVGDLRRDKILIDWKRDSTRNTGMGVWRLDKTKLENYVYGKVEEEMKERNFHSNGSECMIFVRQKQEVFRSMLFEQYKKCAFCMFKIPDYMIGAHIVPYSIMRREEPANAMNPSNGLLLCRLCDVAFENGAIRVEKDRGIRIIDELQDDRSSMIQSWVNSIPTELYVRKQARYPPEPRYLEWKNNLLLGKV